MVLGAIVALPGFTWLLSLPKWGKCGWASLPPAPSYSLWLSHEGQSFLAGAPHPVTQQWVVAPFRVVRGLWC
jgi:hypothetical protein